MASFVDHKSKCKTVHRHSQMAVANNLNMESCGHGTQTVESAAVEVGFSHILTLAYKQTCCSATLLTHRIIFMFGSLAL